MNKQLFTNPLFIKTAVKPSDYPTLRDLSGDILPEIAFVGRSNVGKSSLINDLYKKQGLAKTSSTPGKTQALNFFTANNTLAFVDLPGYGYAKVPKAIRTSWGPMVQNYLENRPNLKVILFLFDIRRLPGEEDKELLDWIAVNQKSMILVLTKVDKVKQNEKAANTRKILEGFGVEGLQYIHYSATKNIGRDSLMHMIEEALAEEEME
jgi:GTP-binding protein